MKIIAISNRVPAPEMKGDQVVSFFRLNYLAKMGHRIELVCFGDSRRSEDQNARMTLESSGVVVHFVHWKPLEAALNLLGAVLNHKMPLQCAIYRSDEFSKTVDKVAQTLKPDALYCVMVRVAENANIFEGKIFVEMVDSMGLNFSRRVALSNFVARWILDLERRRVSAYEKALAERSELSFVVSEIDRRMIDSKKVDVIPLGIDINRFSIKRRTCEFPVIAFTGNMNYQPNVDAICWFIQYCWAFIKQAMPGVCLVIAGNNPQSRLVALGESDTSIMVTGRVPSIAEVLNAASIAIAPMQSGSGMQFKILEAMACGVPVVTSTLGLGDIGAEVGKDLLVGDTPDTFVIAVLQLLRSPELREAVGKAGMRYVRQYHTWDALNSYFEQRMVAVLEGIK